MKRIGHDVQRELGRFEVAADMVALVAAWPAAVGGEIAGNAWPARLARDGTLHVTASSSTWAFELGQLERQIAARLRDALGKNAPARLRFAPGPLPEPVLDSAAKARRAVSQPGSEQIERAAELASVIEGEELRQAVTRAAAVSLAAAASDRAV